MTELTKTTASLFTGGGGFEQGAMMAGYTPVWGVEIVPEIAQVAKDNIQGLRLIVDDVANVNYLTLESPDHLHASTVCKNASPINNVKGKSRESRWDIEMGKAVERAIIQLQPQAFTLENVWQYRLFKAFDSIVGTLRLNGYFVDWWRLNSADYGVPQNRERLILVASKARQPARPQPTHSSVPDPFGIYQPWVSWWEATKDLASEFQPWRLAPWQKKILPVNDGYLLIGNNQNGDNRDRLSHSVKGSPAFTVTVSNAPKIRALVNGEVVRPTRRALLRLQSFPDWYETDNNTVIGNAVPPLLAKAICESLKD